MLEEVIEKLERFGRQNAAAIAKASAKRKKLPTSGDDDEDEPKKDKAKLKGEKTPEQRLAHAVAVYERETRHAERSAVSKMAVLEAFLKNHPSEARAIIEADYIEDDDAPDEQERAVTKSMRRTDLDADTIADDVTKMARNLRAADPKLTEEGAVVKVLERYPHLYSEYVFAKEA